MAKAKDAAAQVPPLGIVEVTVWGCRCRCGHVWVPREWLKGIGEQGKKPDGTEQPRNCPSCKSANWDKAKRWERKA